MKKRLFHRSLMTIMLIYLLLPLVATLFYSFAKEWQNTLLPQSWTLQWFSDLFHDPRFIDALWNSLLISVISVTLSLFVMLPTIFIVIIYFPRLEKLLNILVLLPYAVPGVVAAVGLIRIYSSWPFAISGTIYILIGAYFVAILPYMYQGIRNSMRTINAVELVDAAELLGANKMSTLRLIILPNIFPGVIVSTLLSFSILFGEFVLVNMLVGSHFETIQIYLYNRLNESGHLASAVAISYFIFVLILSAIFTKFSKFISKLPKIG